MPAIFAVTAVLSLPLYVIVLLVRGQQVWLQVIVIAALLAAPGLWLARRFVARRRAIQRERSRSD